MKVINFKMCCLNISSGGSGETKGVENAVNLINMKWVWWWKKLG